MIFPLPAFDYERADRETVENGIIDENVLLYKQPGIITAIYG